MSVDNISIDSEQLFTDYKAKMSELYTATQLDKVKSIMPSSQRSFNKVMDSRVGKKTEGSYSGKDLEKIIEAVNTSYATYKKGEGNSAQANSQGVVRYGIMGNVLREILNDYGYFELAKKINVDPDVVVTKTQDKLQAAIDNITKYHNTEEEKEHAATHVPVQVSEEGDVDVPANIAAQVKIFVEATENLKNAYDVSVGLLMSEINDLKAEITKLTAPRTDDERVAAIKAMIAEFEDPTRIKDIFAR